MINYSKRYRTMFLSFAFVWSFVFWGISIILSSRNHVLMPENADMLMQVMDRQFQSEMQLTTIIKILGGFGPFFAGMFMYLAVPEVHEHFMHKFHFKTPFKYLLQVVVVFLLILAVPTLIARFTGNVMPHVQRDILIVTPLLFGYQIFTEGLEEFGWRGFMLPSLMRKISPIRASVRLGYIRTLWYAPMAVYTFFVQSQTANQLTLSIVAFAVGTMAMSIIHTHYYLKTQNVLLNILIQALGSITPIVIGIFVMGSSEVYIAVQALLCVFAVFLLFANKDFFKAPEA